MAADPEMDALTVNRKRIKTIYRTKFNLDSSLFLLTSLTTANPSHSRANLFSLPDTPSIASRQLKLAPDTERLSKSHIFN